MLPKPEKKSKKSAASEQLELNSAENKVAHLKRKRVLIGLILFLTVGLSFIFWVYRAVKLYFRSPVPLSVNLVLPAKSPAVSPPNLQPLLGPAASSWSIYTVVTDNPTVHWSQNLSTPYDDATLKSLISNLSVAPKDTGSILADSLPQGIEIRDTLKTQGQTLNYQALIAVPHHQMLFLITVTDPDFDRVKSLLPSVCRELYWSLISSS